MRGTRTLMVAAAFMLVLLAVDRALAQEDTIIINIAGKQTTIEKVTVGRETYRTVRYKIGRGFGSSWQEEATDNVIEIIRGDAPPSFRTAENARKDGNWSKAIQNYKHCLNDRKDWVKIYSQFYLAESQRLWGQSDPAKLPDAVKEYEVFISKYSDHRFVPHAHYGKALSARAAGQNAKAKSAFDELGGGRYGSDWEIRGQFYSAQLGGGSGKLKSLIEKAKARGMTDIVAAARLILAKTLLKEGKHREAMRMFKETVNDPEGVGKEVLAAAHNGLGDCYVKLGTGIEDQKKALFEYLKVVVLYASAHNEYLDALKKAIRLLEKIGGDEYKKRAEDLKKEHEKASRGG